MAVGSVPGVASLWRWPDVSPRAAVRMWRRDLTLYRRSWRRNILPNFLEPLLYLLAFGLGLGTYIGTEILDVPYAAFIAPGLAASSAMYGAMFEVTYNVFVKMNFEKLYDAVITTPLEPEDVAAGELLWAVTRSFIYGTAFIAVIVALGHAHSPWTIAAPFALPLIGASMAMAGLIFTALVTNIDRFTYLFNFIVVPMFLFSGIFFPIERLPDAAQTIAWLTPLHHGVEMSRALVLTGDVATAASHAAWLVVFTAVLFPAAIELVRRRLVV